MKEGTKLLWEKDEARERESDKLDTEGGGLDGVNEIEKRGIINLLREHLSIVKASWTVCFSHFKLLPITFY